MCLSRGASSPGGFRSISGASDVRMKRRLSVCRLQSLCLQCAIWAHIDLHSLCWWLHEPRHLQAATRTYPCLKFFSTRFTLNKLFWLFFPSMSKWNRIQPFNLHNKCDFNHNILHPTLIKYTVRYIILTVSAQSYHKLCNTESDTSNHCLQHLDGNLVITAGFEMRIQCTVFTSAFTTVGRELSAQDVWLGISNGHNFMLKMETVIVVWLSNIFGAGV